MLFLKIDVNVPTVRYGTRGTVPVNNVRQTTDQPKRHSIRKKLVAKLLFSVKNEANNRKLSCLLGYTVKWGKSEFVV